MNMRIATPALFRYAIILAGLIIVADQFTKWLIMTQVMNPPRVIPLLSIGNMGLNLVMAWNTGVSFSMLRGTGAWLLSGLPSPSASAWLSGWPASATGCRAMRSASSSAARLEM